MFLAKTLTVLEVIGKVVSALSIFVKAMQFLGPDQQVQRLVTFFKKWKEQVGSDEYYEQFQSLIEADERLQELLETYDVRFPPLEADLEGYLMGQKELTEEQESLLLNEKGKIERQPNVSEECAAALLQHFGQSGEQSA